MKPNIQVRTRSINRWSLPRSIQRRLQEKEMIIVPLQADGLGLSETSATSFVQHGFADSLKATDYSVLWGRAVEAKRKILEPQHDRPSRRGDALGAAILSRLPFRPTRLGGSDALFQSCRFCSCVCHMGHVEVLFVSAYF